MCVFYIYWQGSVNCTEDTLYKAWHLKFAETIIIIVFLEGDLTGLEMHNKTLSLGPGAERKGNLLVGVLLVTSFYL